MLSDAQSSYSKTTGKKKEVKVVAIKSYEAKIKVMQKDLTDAKNSFEK